MKFGIIVFPGTWSDRDCYYALHEMLGQDVRYIWHRDIDLAGLDCVVLPGGFSYGDYLRPGAIARFSPVINAVAEFAAAGKFVIGTCNGFQILCESGLLPGVLMRNDHLQYRCQWTYLKTENQGSAFTSRCGQQVTLKIPISHFEGRYHADASTLEELEASHQVAFRYATPAGDVTQEANPNGAANNIAGILNKRGNVLGMMPHPERSCEAILGSTDGNLIWESIIAGI
ncbi:MAG TPA: phosphoribosylformylglycinamidine synthase subunit PurQ [Dehalococcoidia bacterium]|nr:phosphoribosylformylglycinamidine synthase subunit PurQ [Dehalococcoidia bacterium]